MGTFWEDLLTKGADYAHLIPMCPPPPCFDLPTAPDTLQCTVAI